MPFIYSSVRPITVAHRSVSHTKEKWMLVISVAAIVLSVAGLLVTSLVFIQNVLHKDNQTLIACVPCEKLGSSNNPGSLLHKLTKVLLHDGTYNCCANNSEQMSAMIELVLQKQDSEPEPLPVFNSSDHLFGPASAHKRLRPSVNRNFTFPEFLDKKLVLTNFSKENEPPLEHARGVDVRDQSLRILHSGLYFVYSSIHFQPTPNHPCKDFKFQTWGHYVEKIVPNYPGRSGCILKTSHTCCDQCINDSETSFTSGVFQLQAGDIIQILVSGYGLVYFKSESSFAGLMMLGSNGGDGIANRFYD